MLYRVDLSREDDSVVKEVFKKIGNLFNDDHAYVDFKWLYSIHKKKAFFVTRWKKNVAIAYHEKEEYNVKTGVIC